jgi:hypothetical protein
MIGFRYRLHDTEGDDLGVLEHPAPNVEPEDEVTLLDGRKAIVTRRVEGGAGAPMHALLEVDVREDARLDSVDRQGSGTGDSGTGCDVPRKHARARGWRTVFKGSRVI